MGKNGLAGLFVDNETGLAGPNLVAKFSTNLVRSDKNFSLVGHMYP